MTEQPIPVFTGAIAGQPVQLATRGRDPMFDFPAAFDKPTSKRMERNAQKHTTQAAIYRRIALALMTRSSVELRASVAQDLETAETFLSTAEVLRGAIEWHEAEIKLLRTVEARIFAVLSDTYPEEVEEEQPKAKARDEENP
jgi:hypothetical protein